MVPQTPSVDWLVSQTLIYSRADEDRKKRLWSPWVWRFVRFGIPLVIVWGILGVYIPVLVEEVRYQAQSTALNFQSVFPRGFMMPKGSWQLIPTWVQGYALEIPKLGVRESVVDNVDAGNQQTYMAALTKGVAHASGSSLPGQPGVQYYFAHSSGLPFWGGRAVTFATLYKLDTGDDVFIYKDKQKFQYRVTEKHIVSADDVGLLTATSGNEQVVLQTCWPIGTNWQRLLVVAEKS